jgi:hypothetical protein
MIHEIDPNHLTTTSLAGITQKEISLIKEKCSDLDLLSVQMYGSIATLPKLIKEYGWEGPYMVTEWGATGHWEVPKTSWDAPIEENSSVKAANSASNLILRNALALMCFYGVTNRNAHLPGTAFSWKTERKQNP